MKSIIPVKYFRFRYVLILCFNALAVLAQNSPSHLPLLKKENVYTRETYPLDIPIPKIPVEIRKITHITDGEITQIQEFRYGTEVFTKEKKHSKVAITAVLLNKDNEVVKAYKISGKRAYIDTFSSAKPLEVTMQSWKYKLKRRDRKRLKNLNYESFLQENWISKRSRKKKKLYKMMHFYVNGQGQKTKEVTFTAKGDTIDTDTFSYDTDGYPAQSILRYKKGNNFTCTYYFLPLQGSAPKKLSHFTWEKKNKAGETLTTHTMRVKYDERGFLAQTDIYRDSDLEQIYYSCDEQGRMTMERQPMRDATDYYSYTANDLVDKVIKHKADRKLVEVYEYEK